jgi:plasmid stabilization system protein ParE
MPRKKAITFAALAVKDLDDIHTWYADQQISAVGDNLIREIISKIERLGSFPESGRIVPEFGIANLREIICSPFRIIYRFDEKRVRVVRVWRCERLLKMPEN